MMFGEYLKNIENPRWLDELTIRFRFLGIRADATYPVPYWLELMENCEEAKPLFNMLICETECWDIAKRLEPGTTADCGVGRLVDEYNFHNWIFNGDSTKQ